MGNFIQQRSFNNLDQVSFANHVSEFTRFYDRHKSLCDEISGIKKRMVFENGFPVEYYIDRNNFFLAIKRLNSFLIDNIHYIDSKSIRKELIDSIQELEKKYYNDEKYNELKNNKKLSNDENFEFDKSYVDYILDCFKISYQIFANLQDSMMITTRDRAKSIKYYDTKNFFENLSSYRDEISNNIADFKIINSIDHFKKMMGYYYTYKFIVSKENVNHIEKMIEIIYSYLFNEEFKKYIAESRKENIDEELKVEMYQKMIILKNMLSEIYIKTNESLSERNILPKIENKIIIDKTLI